MIAREILSKLGASDELMEEVCDIIGHHHHPRTKETTNFKAVYDADQIVNLEEKYKEGSTDPAELAATINKAFLTKSGIKLAKDALLKN